MAPLPRRQSEPEAMTGLTKMCTACASTNSTFCYLDNGKADQPRYRCLDCGTFFAVVDHGRKHGKKYGKKRNVDPEEVRDLPRHCPKCKRGDRVPFRYYNNKCPTQLVFECVPCKKRFQMRLEASHGSSERRLVHTGKAAQGTKNAILRPPKKHPCTANSIALATCGEYEPACSMLQHEPESQMDMAGSMEFEVGITNGDLVDVERAEYDIFDGALTKMRFYNDQASKCAPIPHESMFDDHVCLSDFAMPSIVPADDINVVQAPLCVGAEEACGVHDRRCDMEAAVMADDFEPDEIENISSELYDSIMEGLPALPDMEAALKADDFEPKETENIPSELYDSIMEGLPALPDMDAALKADDFEPEEIENISSELYDSVMDGLPALPESEPSGVEVVPNADDSFASELEASMLEDYGNDMINMPF